MTKTTHTGTSEEHGKDGMGLEGTHLVYLCSCTRFLQRKHLQRILLVVSLRHAQNNAREQGKGHGYSKQTVSKVW